MPHHRRSIGLRDYDYARSSAYMVTLCTAQREWLFGMVSDGEMVLNAFGRTAREEWLHTADLRPGVELDAFIIMPNHMHGIIVIHDTPVGAQRPLRTKLRQRRVLFPSLLRSIPLPQG